MNNAVGCGIFVAIFGFLFAGLTALSIGGMAFGYAWDWYTAPLKGAQEARQIIQADGNFRLQAYNYFYNQCTSVQKLEAEIDAQTAALETLTNEQYRQVVQVNIAAIRSARQQAVLEYNQNSHKQWTEAQFKSEALPYEIPDSPYVIGRRTLCAI